MSGFSTSSVARLLLLLVLFTKSNVIMHSIVLNYHAASLSGVCTTGAIHYTVESGYKRHNGLDRLIHIYRVIH